MRIKKKKEPGHGIKGEAFELDLGMDRKVCSGQYNQQYDKILEQSDKRTKTVTERLVRSLLQ